MKITEKYRYMVKTYETRGPLKGMTKEKVYFYNLEDAKRFYADHFDHRNLSYNPTMWENHWENWIRIYGF